MAAVLRHSIRTKLLVGLVVVLLMVASLASGSLVAIYAYRDTIRALDDEMGKLALVDELRLSVAAMMTVSAVGPGEDPEVADRLVHQMQQSQGVFGELEQRAADIGEQALPQALRDTEASSLEQARQSLKTVSDQVRAVKHSQRLVERRFLDKILTPVLGPVLQPDVASHLRRLYEDVSALEKAIRLNVGVLLGHARSSYRTSRAVVFATAAMVVVLIVALVFAFHRWIVKPIRHLHTGVGHLKLGRFDHRITLETGDEMEELADEFNAMTARLRDIYRSLEDQVAEKSKQLARSERLASVGYLGAGVAHEINNPLASIAGCAEALAGRLGDDVADALPDEDREVVRNYLKTIQDEAFRCRQITQRLLEFCRMGELRATRVDLNSLVRDVVDTVQHLDAHKDKEVTFTSRTPLMVRVNPLDIKQVILNLCINGLESMADGGRLDIQSRAQQGQAVLECRDSGVGMAPATVDKIFEPFVSLKPGGRGVGLGLSISHGIVQEHGGALSAHSPGLNQGSTFTVTLPLADGADAASESEGHA